MSETDELRRMLDERGAKYEVDDAETVRVTHWEAYGDWVSFIEYDNGETKFYIDARRMTPAQAIAATVGRDERESYDAGFASGVKATLQQLYGLLYEYPTLDEIEAWADSQWEVDE